MTSNRALAAIFLAPLVMLLGVGVAVAIDSGDLGPLELMALLGLATSALIFAVAWLLGSRATREHGPKFDALRAALGGSVLKNWLGEHQLRVPDPRGHLEIDHRVYSSDGESHEPYTRVALVLQAGSLPRRRVDLLRDPGAEKKLGPATRAEVAALRGRVRLLGRGPAPSVEVWVFGWLDVQEVARLVASARPRLEALVSRSWTT